MPVITITLQVCGVEPFLYQATPQPSTLNSEAPAYSAQVNEQQLEGFLERLREAICTDVTELLAAVQAHETRITALET